MPSTFWGCVMGFSFRKKIKVLPGVRVNLSRKGISGVNLGKTGASVTAGKKGVYTNLGLEGSGLHHRHKIGLGKSTGLLSVLFWLFVVVFIVLALAGCAVPNGLAAQKYVMKNQFDENQAKFSLLSGKNTVSGTAFLKRNDGMVVTCAGSPVLLIPVTDYYKERSEYMFSTEIVENKVNYTNSLLASMLLKNLPKNDEVIEKYNKRTTCDQNGNFKFTNIAGGKYYLTTLVVWSVANRSQGGMFMMKIDASKNNENLILTVN